MVGALAVPPPPSRSIQSLFITGSTIETPSGPESAVFGDWSCGSGPTVLGTTPTVALQAPTALVAGSVAL